MKFLLIFATSKVGKKNSLIIYAPRWLLSVAKQPLLRNDGCVGCDVGAF